MATSGLDGPGRIPPQNLPAERAVLGAILLEPTVLPRAIEVLIPEDFYKEGHRQIYATMLRLFERSEPTDQLTVAEELRRQGVLEEVGGQTALATLVEEATVSTNFGAYATIVREKALLRELIRVTRELSEKGFEEADDVQELLDRAEQMLFRLSERRLQRSALPVRDILSRTIQHIETLYHRKEDITGLPNYGVGSRDITDLAGQTLSKNHQYPDGLVLYVGTMFAPIKDRDTPGGGFTHKIDDIVTVSTPRLGALVNRVRHCPDAAPWTFGTGALMRNLAARGLLHAT